MYPRSPYRFIMSKAGMLMKNATQNSQVLSVIRTSAILLIITGAVALLLSVINAFASPVIEKNTEKQQQDAIRNIFDSVETVTPLNVTCTEPVTAVYEVWESEELLGYCVNVSPMGFSDVISMVVGIRTDITVAGIEILSISDTPGLGMNVSKPAYLDQFKGLTEHIALGGMYNSADAISGATISSKAVLNGVNAALDACAAWQESSAANTDIPEFSNTGDSEMEDTSLA